MKLSLPLRHSIPVALALLAAILTAVGFFLGLYLSTRAVDDLSLRRATGFGSSVAPMLERLLIDGNPAVAEQQIAFLAVVPNLSLALVADATGDRVLYATDPAYRNHAVDETLPAEAKLLVQQARESLSAKLAISPDGNTLHAAFPINRSPGPGELNPSPLGMFYTRTDLTAVKQDLVVVNFKRSLGIGLTAIMACLGVWVFLHATLTRRVKQLLTAVAAYPSGHTDIRAPTDGVDEIASIGRAVNQMMDELTAQQTALRENEARLNEAQRIAKKGSYTWEPSGRHIWSDYLCTLVGLPAGATPTFEGFLRAVAPEDRARVDAEFQAFIASSDTESEAEYRIVGTDGTQRFIRADRRAERDAAGKVVRVAGTLEDITERKQAEERLRESEAQLNAAQHLTGMGSWTVSSRDHAIWSRNMFVLHGLPVGAPPDYQRLLDLFVPEDRARFDAEFQAFVASTETRWETEYRIAGADGTTRTLVVIAQARRNAEGRVVQLVGTTQDITERRNAEAERERLEFLLRQAQKSEALGTLAGGIAHDFNNLLAVIVGNLELARQELGPDHPAQESLSEIDKASARASDLVQQILTFSRRRPQERNIIRLQEVVEESVRLLKATLPAGIELVVTCAPGTPNVLADRTQIYQILMNLCTNARHAITGQTGRIEVTLSGVDLSIEDAHSGLPPGRYARLRISDTGMGMDAATMARIFDPFFTTKAPGEGTGLGLAVVDGIVKNHGGTIMVYSKPGRGTVFHLSLPAAGPVVESTPEAPVAPQPGGNLRILFLDDEEPLVSLAMRFLGGLGYQVRCFTRPAEALAAFRSDPARFDLAITDLNMPAQSGLEVAKELLRMRPDLPVALASGYLTAELRAEAEAVGIREFLHKPHTMRELAEMVQRLMDGKARG